MEKSSGKELRSVAQKLIDRRQIETNRWEGIVQQYVEKVREEHTASACEQLGMAVYELHTSEFLLSELKRTQKQLSQQGSAKPCESPPQAPQLPVQPTSRNPLV